MTNQDAHQLNQLIEAAYLALDNIRKSEQFQAIEYSPDLSINDAVTALEYLLCELPTHE